MRYTRNPPPPRKAPRYEPWKEVKPSNDAKKYCSECFQIQPARHLCNPKCRRCNDYYGAGNSICDQICGLFPCCGCCNEALNDADLPTEINQQHGSEIRFPDLQSTLPIEINQRDGSEIRFPDLQSILRQLCDFLFSEAQLEIDIERGVYQSVIKCMGGQEAFVHLLLNTIDPDIRALKGQSITPQVLHAIREKQMALPGIWKDPHGGYLDFVTQLKPLNPTYLRNYVGQSGKPRIRIPQHIREISKASKASLHYFIVSGWQSGSRRQANFIRIWTIPFPPNINATAKLVFENCLEMTMCRAFQSLPSSSLEEVFGPCPDSDKYSGVGLNVMSPLLQGRSLHSYTRHKVVQLLLSSPDPEIREFPTFRKDQKHQLGEKPESQHLPIRRYMHKDEYRDALQNAIRDVEEGLITQDGENTVWGPLEVHSPVMDAQSWFQNTVAKLRHDNPTFETEATLISPIGSLENSVGLVFESTPLNDYKDEDGKVISMPWGLRESGFQPSNSLIWPFNFQRYTDIPQNFQIQSPSGSEYSILGKATQELIASSKLRVIIICGDIEDAVVPNSTKKTVLLLNNIEFKIWVEIQQCQLARLFIQAPTPLSKLWASHGRQAYDLASIFKFVSAVTDIKIFPSFYECSLCLALIVRGWADERGGELAPIANPQDLAPILKVYMADKGVDETGLRRLMEATKGSLRHALLVFVLILPKPRGKVPRPPRIPLSKVKRLGATPKEVLDKVRAIYHDLMADRQASRSKASHIEQETTTSGLQQETTASYVQQETQMSEIEGLLIEHMDKLDIIDDVEPQKIFPTTSDLEILSKEKSAACSISFELGLKLLVGHQYKVSGKLRGAFTISNSTISFNKGHGLVDVHSFWVKAELAPRGTKHSQAWASEAKEQDDPGARLAFKVYLQDEDGAITWATYPTSDAWESTYQANTIVDKFRGTSFRELCNTPRRYINMDKRFNAQMDECPRLKLFIGGAYTDDNLEVIPSRGGNRGRNIKRAKGLKREHGSEDVEGREGKKSRGPKA